ncbi:MAG: hypothetical protein Q8O64_19245 [Sideroxyarcus sp.]|nr:hypothetical protein [Sideroxyarcus sp.]
MTDSKTFNGPVFTAYISNIRPDWSEEKFGSEISFYSRDDTIFVTKDGADIPDDCRVGVEVTIARSDETLAWHLKAYVEDSPDDVAFGQTESEDGHDSAFQELCDNLSKYLKIGDDGLDDILFVLKNMGLSENLEEDFDECKDADWYFQVGNGDQLSMSDNDAARGVLIDVYPPVELEWTQGEDGTIEFDMDLHCDGRDESQRFIGVSMIA